MRLFRSFLGVTVVILLASCGSTTSPSTGGTNNNNNNQTGGHTTSITIVGTTFSPAVDTVAVNSTVTWTWPSGGVVSHNVTFEDGPASATQATGTYQRTFGTAGTYRYRCTIHSTSFTSGMIGTIVVQ
jgi:plastocyanin